MTQKQSVPVALSIAGSDSGGGAGIQADLQTFARFQVHGATAITCVTAQNPRGVLGIQAIASRLLSAQLEAVFAELPPSAVKTGMLYSASLIQVVAGFFAQFGRARPPLIVDPVMIATSGAALLKPAAIRVLRKYLLPLATLVTPNVDEAAALTGQRIDDPEALRLAARQIHEAFGCAVLAKGGHLRRLNEAVDLFYDGRTELLLSTPRVKGVSTHGTGCTYSAAIAAGCAQGLALIPAVQQAKEYISTTIRDSRRVGRHDVLHWAAGGG
jgi:hydroxymethylpyrimidine/phosphomethylpyrimidine kinase